MAQYYQQQPQTQTQPQPQIDHYQVHQHPGYGGFHPGQQQPPATVDNQQFHQEAEAPPLPPEEEPEPPPPGWADVHHAEGNQTVDNIETVAMDDEAVESNGTEIEGENNRSHFEHQKERKPTITQDYNHQPAAPVLPGMQTFDHNHGFNRPPPQPFSHVAPQPIDYGHGQSVDYGHQGPLVPGAQVYDYQPQYDSHYYHQHPYEMDRHHPRFAPEHDKPKSHPPVESLPDLSGLSDVKKKALPMWIREGLEKLEKKKQKKQDHGEEDDSKKSSVNLSASGSSSIAGYDHGKVDSPVRTPKSNDSEEESDTEKTDHPSLAEESDHDSHSKGSTPKNRHSKEVSSQPKRVQSSEEEEEERTEEEKQQELMVNIRKLLTEVLLTVTNEEVTKIAQETYNEALRGPARQLQHSGGLDALRGKGGYLGLGGYGSDSENSSNEESGEEKSYADEDNRKHQSADMEDDGKMRRSRSRSHPGRGTRRQHESASESEEEEDKKKKYRDSGEKRSKKERRHRSPSSSNSDSESSVSVHEKSRRKKHRRRDRSESSSPKHRRRHRRHHGKKSRSRSRSPRKHSSSKKKRKSESESAESDTESRTSSRHKSSKHSRESSQKDKKHRRKRRSSSSSSHNERDGKKDRKRKT